VNYNVTKFHNNIINIALQTIEAYNPPTLAASTHFQYGLALLLLLSKQTTNASKFSSIQPKTIPDDWLFNEPVHRYQLNVGC
jgi:hypothetical protein